MSEAIADIPKSVSQFDWPRPSASARRWARNDGLPMKKIENVAQADARHRVVVVTARPFALVRQTGADPFKFPYQFINQTPAMESRIESRHKGELLHHVGRRETRSDANRPTAIVSPSAGHPNSECDSFVFRAAAR